MSTFRKFEIVALVLSLVIAIATLLFSSAFGAELECPVAAPPSQEVVNLVTEHHPDLSTAEIAVMTRLYSLYAGADEAGDVEMRTAAFNMGVAYLAVAGVGNSYRAALAKAEEEVVQGLTEASPELLAEIRQVGATATHVTVAFEAAVSELQEVLKQDFLDASRGGLVQEALVAGRRVACGFAKVLDVLEASTAFSMSAARLAHAERLTYE